MALLECELETIEKRVAELEVYVASDSDFTELNDAEKYLIKKQLVTLTEYRDILRARCALRGN